MGQIQTQTSHLGQSVPDNRQTTAVALTYDEASCIELMMTRWVEAQEKQVFPSKPPEGYTILAWSEARKGRENTLASLKVLITKMNTARGVLLAEASAKASGKD